MEDSLGLFFTVLQIVPEMQSEDATVLEHEFLIAGNPFHNTRGFDLTSVYEYLKKLPWETVIRYGGIVYEYIEADGYHAEVKEVSRFSGRHVYASGDVADCEDIHWELTELAEMYDEEGEGVCH